MPPVDTSRDDLRCGLCGQVVNARHEQHHEGSAVGAGRRVEYVVIGLHGANALYHAADEPSRTRRTSAANLAKALGVGLPDLPGRHYTCWEVPGEYGDVIRQRRGAGGPPGYGHDPCSATRSSGSRCAEARPIPASTRHPHSPRPRPPAARGGPTRLSRPPTRAAHAGSGKAGFRHVGPRGAWRRCGGSVEKRRLRTGSGLSR